MSTKAVRTAIALQNLDPLVAYSKCNKDGQLAGRKDTDAATEKPVVEETKSEVRNALVEMVKAESVAEVDGMSLTHVEPEVATSGSSEPEEEKKDEESSDVKPRKGGFKKKVVSTDL